jgi:hypothetical protein
MKDARGHGSDARGDSSINDRLKRTRIGMDVNAVFAGRPMRSNLMPSEGQRTVNDLRNRMQTTGPGHQVGLLQGIKNLLGD